MNKKLEKYSALVVAMAGTHTTFGQVVYTDVNPDLIINDGFDYINLDGDANNDFFFNQVDYTGTPYYPGVIRQAAMSGIYPQNMVQYYTFPYSAPLSGIIPAFPASSTIGSTLNFTYSGWLGNMVANPYVSFDVCQVHSPSFVAVQFEIGSNVHYGWIRLEVLNSSEYEIVIYDYAYEATPNTPIWTGWVGLEEQDDGLNIASFQENDQLIVNLSQEAEVQLIDVTGKIVASTLSSAFQHQLNTSALNGVFIIMAVTPDKVSHKKIYLK